MCDDRIDVQVALTYRWENPRLHCLHQRQFACVEPLGQREVAVLDVYEADPIGMVLCEIDGVVSANGEICLLYTSDAADE